jgi:tRNA threonylcarbamoyladenosine biosynthesis protein TsaE
MILLPDAAATAAAGAALAAVVRVGDAIALSGPLGAGKTAFARGLISALGFAGDIPSPSYPLVIPYAPPDVCVPVWHVDLYRLADKGADTGELGLDDARGEGVVIIEWPEHMGQRLWSDSLCLTIAVIGGARCLTARVPPSWEGRCPF